MLFDHVDRIGRNDSEGTEIKTAACEAYVFNHSYGYGKQVHDWKCSPWIKQSQTTAAVYNDCTECTAC